MERMGNLSIEGCRIIFRNFAGKASKYNNEGDRSFAVVLTDEMAEQLSADGWNVRIWTPKSGDPDEPPVKYLPVKVKYGDYPPKIYMITSRKHVLLDDRTVGELDSAYILNVDAILRPYEWNIRGENGITAYAKTLYVTVDEDEFAAKYNI